MVVWVDMVSFNERILVERGREGSVMSSGGLRRDFRETERECSAPGMSFAFFWSGRLVLGRIY
jgi:hypothetical protein